MKRLLMCCAIVFPLVALMAGPALADVKTREKTHVSLGGMLGKVFNFFGGRTAGGRSVTKGLLTPGSRMCDPGVSGP